MAEWLERRTWVQGPLWQLAVHGSPVFSSSFTGGGMFNHVVLIYKFVSLFLSIASWGTGQFC